MPNKQIYTVVFLLLTGIFMMGCSAALEAEFDSYMADMEEIHALDAEYTEKMEQLEIDSLQDELKPRNADADMERLTTISETIDEEIMPIADEMAELMKSVEVSDEELLELHESYEESVQLKHDFADQLSEYVNTYYMSASSNEELIQLSQDFMENQEERDQVIETAESEAAMDEIDDLVEQINENSSEIEAESELLQQDESPEEKAAHIEDVILPLIRDHIESMNQMNLETDSGVRMRSLTLEMYYGFEKYYQVRREAMQYNEKLQELQLQNILPLRETYGKLDEAYYEQLDEIESELE